MSKQETLLKRKRRSGKMKTRLYTKKEILDAYGKSFKDGTPTSLDAFLPDRAKPKT